MKRRQHRNSPPTSGPVPDNQNVMTAAPEARNSTKTCGPREARELRIDEGVPERRMHAKGSARTATFTVTKDILALHQKPRSSRQWEETDLFVRFLDGSGRARGRRRGARHMPGIAVSSSYTGGGNWDLVGNNTPGVFPCAIRSSFPTSTTP